MGIDGAPLVENVFYREHEDRIDDDDTRDSFLRFHSQLYPPRRAIIKLGGIKNLKIEFEHHPSIILFLGEIRKFSIELKFLFFFFKYIIYNCWSIYICSPIESIYKAF